MFNTNNKRVLTAAAILFVAVIISGAVLQKTDAQVDVEACQKEYNASRSKCIADNATCVAACGGNQTCELDCNATKRNACDDAAVVRQKECFGLDMDGAKMPTPSISPEIGTDCSSAYDRDRAACQNVANACYGSCEKGLSDNYWVCMETCTSRITNCGKEARNKFSACDLGAQPPAAKPPEQPPAQTMPPPKSDVDADDDSGNPESSPTSNLPEEIIIDETSYTIALVDASTKKDFEKIVSTITKPSSEVSITLKSEPPTAFTARRDAGIDLNAPVPSPVYNFMLNTANLAIVQPTIIFNDGMKDEFSMDIEELTRSLGASDTDALEANVDSLLQEKILEIMKKNPPAKTVTFSVSKTVTKEPLVILSTAEALTGDIPSPPTYSGSETISAGTSFMAYPGSLVVLDTYTASANVPAVTVGGPAVTSQTQDFDNKAISGVDVNLEVKAGKLIVVAGWSANDTLSATSDYVFSLGNDIEVRHRKTAYGMAIDPDSEKKIIEIYDGEIDIFDRKTGAVLTTLSTKFGKGIKRVEIDKDGVLKQQIAIPQSEWSAFLAKRQGGRFGVGLYFGVVVILSLVAYLFILKKT